MAKKHKSSFDDDVEQTEVLEHEDEPETEQAPAAKAPPPPPAARIQAVTAELQHHAAHNAPVPQRVIKELQSIATQLADYSAPTTPVITELTPTTAPEGTVVLVVTGWNFTPESVICYGDVNQNTQVKSDTTQLTATFESGAPGIYDVNVHDPAGDSNTMTFEVT